jgi:hypothetical protein
VFTVQRVDSPGNYEDADIDAVSVRTGERRHLFHGARRAVWAPGGFLVLARGNDLYAVPIDPRNPRLTQDPVPVLSGVAGDVSSGASFFGIANDGTLAWIPGGEPDGRREIGWLDRSGRWTSTPVPVGPYMRLMLAPDGTRAIVEAGPGGGGDDLWFADLRTGSLNRLTYGARSGSAAWFADGIRFAYSRQDTTGGETIMVRRLDGAGGDRPLYHGSNPLLVSAVTRDGRVLFGDYGVAAGRIHAVPFDHPDSAVTLPAQGSGYEMEGRTSADGRWLAFISNKTRREDIFLRRLDGIGGNWQLSPAGGGGIRWGRGGRELFFVVDESLVRVPIEVRGEGLSIGKIEPVFEVPPSPTEEAFRDYDYDPVSDRFLFTRPPQGAMERREIAISLGWSRRLAETIRARKKTGS